MAFLGMLGHLAHPVMTPVWGRDECSFSLAMRARSGRRTRVHAAVWDVAAQEQVCGDGQRRLRRV